MFVLNSLSALFTGSNCRSGEFFGLGNVKLNRANSHCFIYVFIVWPICAWHLQQNKCIGQKSLSRFFSKQYSDKYLITFHLHDFPV
jgi:hypothetical protein